MSFSIIVATSKNGVIGVDNTLPWHLPKDLSDFKKKTTGKVVIMGRKTFESIGKPLSKRTNIILTRDTQYDADGTIVYNDIEQLISHCDTDKENMIIGGGEIYQLFLPYVDTIYHTYIDAELEGDTKFIIPDIFEEVDKEEHNDGEVSGIQDVKYTFRILKKSQK